MTRSEWDSSPRSDAGSFTPRSDTGSFTPRSRAGSFTPRSTSGSATPRRSTGKPTSEWENETPRVRPSGYDELDVEYPEDEAFAGEEGRREWEEEQNQLDREWYDMEEGGVSVFFLHSLKKKGLSQLGLAFDGLERKVANEN